MPTLTCPTCQTPIQSDDRFCENCGTPLQASIPTAPPAIATTDCQKCGAPAASIDADGYCGQCGFRNLAARIPQESDHVVVTVNSNFAGMSDRGILHQQNEDYFAINQVNISHSDAAQILVVCDGVSSSINPQSASQSASKAACTYLTQALTQALTQTTITPETLQNAIHQAQLAVANLPDARTDDPPSSTIVAAVVHQGIATIGWLGDSRAYWISPSLAQVLTEDHSWANEQISQGILTLAEAYSDPKAHAITRWLGADAELEPAQVMQFTIPSDGYFILCSDGLWNYLADASHLASLIAPDLTAPEIANRLIDYANAKGGKDNITIALVVIPPPPPSKGGN
jgi:PPM family protein phosphatase